jgi:hypothetical protein
MSRRTFLGGALVGGASLAVSTPLLGSAARSADQSLNMKLLGHHDLGGRDGAGKGGEGFAMTTTEDGRRIMYVAQESGPGCFSVVDVTDPSSPELVAQFDVPNPDVRCNSLDLSGDILVIAHEARTAGLKPAGIRIFDVSDPASPVEVGFFDTSGAHSRGAHHVWFVAGHHAFIATGASDFVPNRPNDDQFLMIVDLKDPSNPKEVGRWWYPGTRQGDSEAVPPRNPRFDTGYRLHNVNVHPERPGRAYVGSSTSAISAGPGRSSWAATIRPPRSVSLTRWCPSSRVTYCWSAASPCAISVRTLPRRSGHGTWRMRPIRFRSSACRSPAT